MSVSTAWPRVRTVLCCVGLLSICCRPGPSGYVGVLRVDGSVTQAHEHAITTTLYDMLAAVDIDGDGDDEILASSEFGLALLDGDLRRTTLWEGGEIRRLGLLTGGAAPIFDLLAIVDGDDGPTLTHLSCNGDEPECVASSAFALTPGAFDFVAAHFDDDGRIDVVVADDETLLLHRGIGAESDPLAWSDGALIDPSAAWLTSPGGIAAADIDADGHADLLVADQADKAKVMFGNGDGSFDDVLPLQAPTGVLLETVVVAELTGDTLPDILAMGFLGGMVFENLGERMLSPSVQVVALPFSDGPYAFIGRFDEQPGADILLSDLSLDNARLLVFEASTSSWAERGLGPVARDVLSPSGLVADIDGDGRDEVLSALGLPIYCE